MKALDGDHYHGRAAAVQHLAGLGLKKNRPKWVMAGELQETTRVYARNVARIEPEWIEKAAAHLVDRATSSRTGTRRAARSSPYENVSLFGLVPRGAPQGGLRPHRPAKGARDLHRGRAGGRRVRIEPPVLDQQPQVDPRGRGARAPRPAARRAR
jgi:HrpA-like RNA helicase